MDTRRDFLKKAMMLSGAAGVSGMLPDSIRRAASINPVPGSTYLDAEHVVILMQENRSFDHCFGTLNGVRGFNDPRAISLPDSNKVWLQTNDKAETYVPFRLDIRHSKATWLGDSPHSRPSQVDAWNEGRYDKWLPAKKVNRPEAAGIPLTLGYYTREDIAFQYALADAFTICDQNFSSGMTCTNPNRLFFWTGTVREAPTAHGKAHMRNLTGESRWASLRFDTFPERLQDHGISWKFYQNDIFCGGGFQADERSWLSNFGCNPLEWFRNFNVRFSPRHIQGLKRQVDTLPGEIQELKVRLKAARAEKKGTGKIATAIAKKTAVLASAREELVRFSASNFDQLSDKEKQLYQRAFTTNIGDPDYHKLSTLSYDDEDEKRELVIPKGDILHQFRSDVENGLLPTVSWLAAPEYFSDHPCVPWYGSYYLSEILDILTRNPEVWKKTIFLVTFDENDGYFDHVPPFVAPDPLRPETGKCAPGLSTGVEYIQRTDELEQGISAKEARSGPVGLGYRVPLLIASPWSRGGKVCSEVFDHTSTLQFLEHFCHQKFGKDVRERNISEWRRTITGDLSSAFTPYTGAEKPSLPFLNKKAFIEDIYNAKFKPAPVEIRPLSRAAIDEINLDPSSSVHMPHQESGQRPSCGLPYELYGVGTLTTDKKSFSVKMTAGDKLFGKKTAGVPFNIYVPVRYASHDGSLQHVGSRSYALRAGESLIDQWNIASFEHGIYHVRLYGPNGFFREFRGTEKDPAVSLQCLYETGGGLIPRATGHIKLVLTLEVPDNTATIQVTDNSYGNKPFRRVLGAGAGEHTVVLDLSKSDSWYDLSITVEGFPEYERRFAGRVETGKDGFTDPVLG